MGQMAGLRLDANMEMEIFVNVRSLAFGSRSRSTLEMCRHYFPRPFWVAGGPRIFHEP